MDYANPLNSITLPISYDFASRTFELYTENVSLIGMRKLELKAYLVDYPAVIAPTIQEVDVDIIDVCLAHFLITAVA